MTPIPIHLDTDIGGDIDDLCALAYLLASPRADLTAITTVLEHDGKRAGYARYAATLAGQPNIPIAAGADLTRYLFNLGAGLPPEDRYWPEPIPPLPSSLHAALDLLQHSIETGATIVAIGPCTNLSLLEHRHPGILRHADLFIMGGFIHPPPPGFPAWTHEADYNFQCDTAGNRHVLASADPARVTLIPIEVTVQTALTHAHLPTLRQSNPLARLIARQADATHLDYRDDLAFGRPHPGLPDDLVNFQHDPLACAVALRWPSTRTAGATVQTIPLTFHQEGAFLRLTPDPAGPPFNVVTAVHQQAFATHWLDTVTHASAAAR